jgi:ribosome-binding factor A
MNPRIKRVNQLIKEEVAKTLSKDIQTGGVLITVTRADTSPDLNQSKIYVSVMPETREEEIFALLRENIYDVQQQLNKRLNMRPVPRIRFLKEKKSKAAGRVEEILERIKKNKDNQG